MDELTPVFLVLATIQYRRICACAKLQVGRLIHLRPNITVRFSSFLQQCSTAKGNKHMRSNNKMATEHAFARSFTSRNRSVSYCSKCWHLIEVVYYVRQYSNVRPEMNQISRL